MDFNLRGKCKEKCEELISGNPSLKLVRGWYYEPVWGKDEEHWWCEDEHGTIIDPTKEQFPSKGNSFYTKFNGVHYCEECGKPIKEEEFIHMGHYVVCSDLCAKKLVGV